MINVPQWRRNEKKVRFILCFSIIRSNKITFYTLAWTDKSWINDYLVFEEKFKPIDDSPESVFPTYDSFYHGVHEVKLDVRDLSNFKLRGNGAFGSVYYGRAPGSPSIEIAAKVCDELQLEKYKRKQFRTF